MEHISKHLHGAEHYGRNAQREYKCPHCDNDEFYLTGAPQSVAISVEDDLGETRYTARATGMPDQTQEVKCSDCEMVQRDIYVY